MGCAETIKEMTERKAGFDSRKMGYQGQIHAFLNGSGRKKAKTCGTTGHYVLMVAKY